MKSLLLGLTVLLVLGLQLLFAGIAESARCKETYQPYTLSAGLSFNGLPLLLRSLQECQNACNLYPACVGLHFSFLGLGLGLLGVFPCVLNFNQLSYYSLLSIKIGTPMYRRVQECDGTSQNLCTDSTCNGHGKCETFGNAFKCTCDAGFTGANCQTVQGDSCAGLKKANPGAESGVYTLPVASLGKSIEVYCDMTTNGGGWTVLQKRQDGSEDFNRGWDQYAKGFGSITGEFWIGNDIIAALASTSQLLRIELKNKVGEARYEQYENFKVAGSSDFYRMTVGAFAGDAGDSLSTHSNNQFSTFDQDHDNSPTNCAKDRYGAWWFNNCHNSNLNGQYETTSTGPVKLGVGINWKSFGGWEGSLTFSEMKIRPMDF